MQVKFRIYIVVFILILIACIVCLLTLPMFHAQSIELENGSEEMIEEIEAITKDKSIFLADRDQIKKAVEKDPFLIYEGISYKLPSTVVVEVSTREQAFYVEHYNNYLYLSYDLVVLSSQRSKVDNHVPLVKGLDINTFNIGEVLSSSNANTLEALLNLVGKLSDSGLVVDISEIDVSDIHNIKMVTTQGYTVEFGNAQDVESKIEWINAIIRENEKNQVKSCEINVVSPKNPTYKVIN